MIKRIGLVLLLLAVGIYVAVLYPYQRAISEMTIGEVDLRQVPDGIYEGSADAVLVAAKVRVIVEDHRIIKIDLLRHNHGRGGAAEALLAKVEEAQSLQVDLVSGATASSKVILKAIEDALTI
ncbi:MAG: FMN-binding protein [Limnochordia bacterium]